MEPLILKGISILFKKWNYFSSRNNIFNAPPELIASYKWLCRTCNLKEPTTWQQPQKSAFVFDAVHFKFFSPFLFLWATTKIGAKRYVVACYYLVKQWSKSLSKVCFDSCILGISSTDFVMTKFECWMFIIDFLKKPNIEH